MADFIAFQEGDDVLLATGLPSTCHFLLSTDTCDVLTPTSTLAGGVGEITGTGYARISQAAPTPAAGSAAFSNMVWNTGSASDWPANVKSVILATTADNSGHAICGWNLIPGGASRDMSGIGAIESVTPTLTTESISVPNFANTVAFAAVTGAPSLTPTTATAYILDTTLSLVDTGSNLHNTGSTLIYLVPTTGTYELLFNFNIELNLAGSGTVFAQGFYGFCVGSSSSGTANVLGTALQEIGIEAVGGDNQFWTFNSTYFLNLTAGEYVNPVFEIDYGSTITLDPQNDYCSWGIKQVA